MTASFDRWSVKRASTRADDAELEGCSSALSRASARLADGEALRRSISRW